MRYWTTTTTCRSCVLITEAKQNCVRVAQSLELLLPREAHYRCLFAFSVQLPLPRAPSSKNDADRLKNNRQVKREGHVLQIEQVILQLVECILDA